MMDFAIIFQVEGYLFAFLAFVFSNWIGGVTEKGVNKGGNVY